MKIFKFMFLFASLAAFSSCNHESKSVFSLPYEKYTLGNGLQVVLNKDTSDPIVTVAINYRVGSSREKPGKTGFAHFFEHMLFQRSENLPRNAFINYIDKLGGSFNGFTNQESTCYFETVPRNALEKVLWMESDRMGFFINTVTDGGLRREIDVVSNEKRQGENRPYGHLYSLLLSNFYPKDHPYSWTVIGEIPDLHSSTIDDVKEFYHTYYLPANATLVVSGDFDPAEAKTLIEKYFGEIAAKAAPAPLPVQPVILTENKKIVYSDSHAPSPLIAIVYPSVEKKHKDKYAIELLCQLLGGDKSSPLYKRIVEEKGLAPEISFYNNSQEIAGMSYISTTALPNINLNEISIATADVMREFGEKGVNLADLDKYKTKMETEIYGNAISTSGKAINMAISNNFSGRPDQVVEDLKRYKAVTAEDIMAVYQQYFKDANTLTISIVPKGQENLAVAGSVEAVIAQESIQEQRLASKGGEIIDDPYEHSASKIDRSIEPGLLANTPKLNLPQVWESKVGEIEVRGIQYSELPLVNFNISLGEGMLKDPKGKVGTAYMTAALMNEGTAFKTPDELIAALGNLGASVNVNASSENMSLSGTCLIDKFPQVMEIVSEMILSPRWDEKSFGILKAQTLDNLRYRSTLPQHIASNVLRKNLFGKDNIESNSSFGNEKEIESITIDDLKKYYDDNISSAVAKMNIVGNLTSAEIGKIISPLALKWEAKPVEAYEFPNEYPAAEGKVLFVDYPEARQSYILIGNRSAKLTDKDAYPLTIINKRLGSSASSFFFKILRLQYGYTYGAYSAFSQSKKGLFTAQASVQATVTKESLNLFDDIISNYAERFDSTMLAETTSTLRSQSYQAYETPNALLGILNAISNDGLPKDYISRRERTLDELTLEEAKGLIQKYINLDDMVIVVVGDKKTQLQAVKNAGLGEIVIVDRAGNEI